MRLWNFRGEQNRITDALQLAIPDHAVISVTGAGGKTSLIIALARELAASGKRTVITTTTHMARPGVFDSDPYDEIPFILAEDAVSKDEMLSDIDRILADKGILMAVSPDPDNPAKITAPPVWVMDHLYKAADAVLIEADGSRRMPFKWPAPWEPVIPENTNFTVCVAGLSALGKPLAEVMYRCEDLPEGLQRELVDETLIRAVLSSLDGGQKGAQGEYRVFLNQADTEDLQKIAARMQQMFAVCGIQSAWGTLL